MLLNDSARQKQTAASILTRPSISLQHGLLSGFSNAPTGKTGTPSTSRHSTFILVVSFGQVSASAGGDCSPGMDGRFGIGGIRFGMGGSMFGMGGSMFGIGGSMFGMGGIKLGTGGSMFGTGGSMFGIGGMRFGIGGKRFGIGGNRFGI